MNGLTAWLALEMLGLSVGQTLAVTGAAGAVGGYVVQLAKVAHLHVIADASQKDEPLVRNLGADELVRRGDDVADRIRGLVPEGVDGVGAGAANRVVASLCTKLVSSPRSGTPARWSASVRWPVTVP